MTKTLTHSDLCRSAAAWLRSAKNCAVAAVEMVAMANEKPDVIGWKSYDSHVVEVKMSRADFLRDKKKWHRREPGRCMGDFRWYCCPKGVITPADLPPKWGLVVYDGRACRQVVRAERFDDGCITAERAFLVSIARRLRDGCEYIRPKLGAKNHVPLNISVPVECQNGHPGIASLRFDRERLEYVYGGVYEAVAVMSKCPCPKGGLGEGWRAVGDPFVTPLKQ